MRSPEGPIPHGRAHAWSFHVTPVGQGVFDTGWERASGGGPGKCME